uniref:Protein with signal anchor n=1 Tax=Culex tarsalis TaxID=7177 RepID=A0A1Q3FXH9_CULTA
MANRLASSPYFRRFLVAIADKGAPATRAMSRNPYSDPRGFTLTDMKKNPAVIPLVVIIGVAVSGLTSYCVYAGLTRPDVSLNKKVFEWDTMDVMNPKQLKIRVFNQVPKPMPELAKALSYREEYNKQNAGN